MSRRSPLLLALFSLSLTCLCATSARSAGAERQPPALRLDDRARPVRYQARVSVDPARPTFDASIDIDLTFARATDLLWLNATDLTIRKASFTVGETTIPARVVRGNNDFVGFAVAKPLSVGAARLHIEYQGKLSRREETGLFAQRERGQWYAITQFEAIYARRVFPCFDEPDFKVPWRLTLEVPKGEVALSNTPVSTEAVHGARRTVTFVETPPLPSYLIAFAVGPYELVDAGKVGAVPLRIAAPAGRGKDARYAAQVSAEALRRLEQYFGMPYPFAKLDLVAIPITTSFGAMENPGMVTFAQNILIASPSNQGLNFERYFTVVAIHEFAHQWFGDLVTMKWWNDLWLNESFASWMEGKIIEDWHPEWNRGTSFVEARRTALRADALASARQIRQPIQSTDDIVNAFDRITYEKGESVLAMFERFVGAEVFQRGIRSYLAKHKNGNATGEDFIAAIGEAAGRNLGAAWRSFLDQPGAPLVDVSQQCAAGKPTTLALSQERYRPLGSTASAEARWQIPMCVRHGSGKATTRTCALVTEPKQTLSLGTGCPSFLLANDHEVGYYRATYAKPQLQALLGPERRQLSVADQVGLVDDAGALSRAGRLPLGDLLALTPTLAADSRRQLAEEVIALAENLHEWLVPPALVGHYARYVEKVWGDWAHKVGWTAHPKEDDDTRLLRPSLLGLVAEQGQDATLRTQAVALAERWLSDRHAVDADVAGVLLRTAARAGGAELFAKFHQAARQAADRQDRVHLLIALGHFTAPKLAQQALAIVSSKEFDPRESIRILRALGEQPETRLLAWDYLRHHFEALARRLPPEMMGNAPSFVPFCDEAHQKEVAAFFRQRSPKLPGGPRELAQALERIGLCRANVAAQTSSVTAFLQTY